MISDQLNIFSNILMSSCDEWVRARPWLYARRDLFIAEMLSEFARSCKPNVQSSSIIIPDLALTPLIKVKSVIKVFPETFNRQIFTLQIS